MKAKTRTNQPVEFENYDLPDGTTIEGDLDVTGDIDSDGLISGDEIIEKMSGYSFEAGTSTLASFDYRYVGVVKNGNKLTFTIFVEITALSNLTGNSNLALGTFTIPAEIGSLLYPSLIGGQNILAGFKVQQYGGYLNSAIDGYAYAYKPDGTHVGFGVYSGNYTEGDVKTARIELTFLLSDNLAA